MYAGLKVALVTFFLTECKARRMDFEERLSKWLAKSPDIVVSLFWAFLFTGGAYLFVFFAKSLYALPKSFDLPWLLFFLTFFFIILVRKRVKRVQIDQKPALS